MVGSWLKLASANQHCERVAAMEKILDWLLLAGLCLTMNENRRCGHLTDCWSTPAKIIR